MIKNNKVNQKATDPRSPPGAESCSQWWISCWIIINVRCRDQSNLDPGCVKSVRWFNTTLLVLVVLVLTFLHTSQSESQKFWVDLNLWLFFVEKTGEKKTPPDAHPQLFSVLKSPVESLLRFNQVGRECGNSCLLTATHSHQDPIFQSPAYSLNEK